MVLFSSDNTLILSMCCQVRTFTWFPCSDTMRAWAKQAKHLGRYLKPTALAKIGWRSQWESIAQPLINGSTKREIPLPNQFQTLLRLWNNSTKPPQRTLFSSTWGVLPHQNRNNPESRCSNFSLTGLFDLGDRVFQSNASQN